MRTCRLEENSPLNYTSANDYVIKKSTIISMGEVTVMLSISSLTVSAGNQNNSMPLTRRQKLNGKQTQLVCSQQWPGNEVILSVDADNLLKSSQGWD